MHPRRRVCGTSWPRVVLAAPHAHCIAWITPPIRCRARGLTTHVVGNPESDYGNTYRGAGFDGATTKLPLAEFKGPGQMLGDECYLNVKPLHFITMITFRHLAFTAFPCMSMHAAQMSALLRVFLLLALSAGSLRAQEIAPFKINVEDSVLEDLRERLAKTRWPDQIAGSGWDYGVEVAYMRRLVEHWRTSYDWRQQERALNAFPQFTTELDGVKIHFIHARSKHADATPLLLVHGWPGSFCEFQKIIPMLTEPEKFGGTAKDAFHVVCPSLPGFGFSGKPAERGWSADRMAETFAKLMARLGYTRYGAQGGDWGMNIVRWLGGNDGAHCVGVHSNFPLAGRPNEEPMRGVTPEEVARYEKRNAELADHRGYGAIQGSRPLTLGYALNDSPAGLAAWIVDKFWAWGDHGGDLERSFTKDELLTNVMIYWVTQTMPSSTRIYFEPHGQPRPPSMTEFKRSEKAAPVGFALFPKEINVPPRAWVERAMGGSLIHWTEMPRGGHFAALEQPQLLAEDIRAFFRKARAAEPPEKALAEYRSELTACRAAHGGEYDVPDVKFFLFGMGARTKLLYRDGILFDAKSGRELHRWKVRREIIVPSDYLVALETEDGSVVLREDSEAVWVEQDGQRTVLEGTRSPVKLPDFAGKKFPRVLRVLHQELLVNIVEAGPVPNFFVYEKPWYRDGAMVALALKETGNLDLLKPWILGLREPFDKNNKGETEADNLGQALFLISLVADKNHPLVAKVLAEVPRFEKTDATGKYILGRSDFSDHPVYQTKWLKYGLRALGLPDPYIIPKIADGYGALFWMDYRDQHIVGKDSDDRGPYPYLGWACDHFHGTKKSPLSNRDYPLTWEQNASGANYSGLKPISPTLVEKRISPPHTWHAAEAFLLLLTE